MNTEKALQLLSSYLKDFNKSFIIHPAFINELMKLLKKELRGQEADFFKKMVTQLNNIITFKKSVYTVDSNEILMAGNDENGSAWELFSIHIQSNTYNVRFIVSFDNNSCPILLTVFYERAGKRKTNYTEPCRIAKIRKSELLKGRI